MELQLLKGANLYVALGAAATLWLLAKIITIFRNPLSKVPGPWYTHFTALPNQLSMFKGFTPGHAHKLHQKYGRIVRIGPDEISIAEIDDIKKVYGHKETFLKHPAYRALAPSKVDSMFNTSDVDLHRRYRRLLASPMSESSLKSAIPDVYSRATAAVYRMGEELQSRGAMDVYKWWFFFTTDTLGELTFGSSFNMIESGKKNQYFEDILAVNKFGGIRLLVPGLTKLAQYITIPIVDNAVAGGKRMRDYAMQSIARQKDAVLSGDAKAKDTLFSKVFKAKDDDTLTEEEMTVNAQTYIVAGSDTTSNTLTYLTWAVCRRPDIRARLVAEVAALPDDFTEADTRELRYLEQVIAETMRLHAAAPCSLARVVPPEGVCLSGYYIEGGTTVGCQGYTMHRDRDIFPEPDEFKPERWENPTRAMKEAYMPFGRGARTCVGSHLAMIEIRLGVCLFFRQFPNATVSTKEGMSDADMESKIYFLNSPAGKRCLIEG
ncbi:putative sterigmatocystin biosynthesis P450 monooxygenase STCB [Beauveria bassiana]|nr:putative sterigmatocystin biosynthesis P450 monooxygenase STCB [Beauveria bassiana]KAH8721128.1 Cytochrome P450 monooxygenase azaI [Beauveria bassiana]